MQRCLGCMKTFGKEYDVCPYCGFIVGEKSKSTQILPPGTVLQNRYVLGKMLGQGGFGITYIAWDNKLNISLAIKEYFPVSIASRSVEEKTVSFVDEGASHNFRSGLAKMLDETRRLVQFDGQNNIVRVFDVIEENGTAYMIMEHLHGKTVNEILSKNGQLSFDETMSIIRPVFHALTAMHSAGLIHRDVAPDNIFVCDDGCIKLLDLGAARGITTPDDATRSVVLKKGYAPIEQYSEKSSQGTYTDVYATCATMYKMLTGQTLDTPLDRMENDEISLPDSIPKHAQTAIKNGLAIHPESRTQTVEELEKQLLDPSANSEIPNAHQINTRRKKFFISGVSILLVLAIVLGITFGVKRKHSEDINVVNSTITGYNPAGKDPVVAESVLVSALHQGDVIEYGMYPQSEVVNVKTIARLSELAPKWDKWTSYGYYSGTGKEDGKMKPENFMRYVDVELDGNKYRGVKFTEYRPESSYEPLESASSSQPFNGYEVNTVYWFLYEPVRWCVLDSDSGLVLSEQIIDAQAFHNFSLMDENRKDWDGESTYWGNEKKTNYANNYVESTVRQWLTGKEKSSFLNTAFSSAQQKQIKPTVLDNSAYDDDFEQYNASSTKDKVFLLSYDDASNPDYGFSADIYTDSSRVTTGTDYALCQGLFSATNYTTNRAGWYLRTPGFLSNFACHISDDGYLDDNQYTFYTNEGIRPAITLNEKTEVLCYRNSNSGTSGSPVKPFVERSVFEYGEYPQSLVTDKKIIAKLDKQAPTWEKWISYGYYSGTGERDGNMHPGDFMRYVDLEVDGNKYRGVKFTEYRPENTILELSEYYAQPDEWGEDRQAPQEKNGYKTNTVYWFRYEPIQWRVLDAEKGLVLCDKILDSQPIHSYAIQDYSRNDSEGDIWGDDKKTFEVCNYTKCDLRQWLNNESNDGFLGMAFSETEIRMIQYTLLYFSGDSAPESDYDATGIKDKIFLLSEEDVMNNTYGFSLNSYESDANRKAIGTDYAKCQGLFVDPDTSTSNWFLRTPEYLMDVISDVSNYGDIMGTDATSTDTGIRPVMTLKPETLAELCSE